MKNKPKIIKKSDKDKCEDSKRRAEIAALRGVCGLLAIKYPEVLIDEYRKLDFY